MVYKLKMLHMNANLSYFESERSQYIMCEFYWTLIKSDGGVAVWTLITYTEIMATKVFTGFQLLYIHPQQEMS